MKTGRCHICMNRANLAAHSRPARSPALPDETIWICEECMEGMESECEEGEMDTDSEALMGVLSWVTP